ncbi:hypothetical protein AAL_00894 [Moelleriella libera RCEF 2490]|uniref:Pantothenate transporter liz1 n=1 Tax=Moelleriella libera RCEF 2490 TaxID=1081109 RepID=A0A166V9S4_9HYPO|nr:hypothetical protein AAL_00894 [Moelleriella libera RCEF 2490]
MSRVAAARSFSILTAARTAARSMEAHPFQRLSNSQRSARGDWAGEGKRLGKQAVLFFPGITMLLGWPFAAKALFDGHV